MVIARDIQPQPLHYFVGNGCVLPTRWGKNRVGPNKPNSTLNQNRRGLDLHSLEVYELFHDNRVSALSECLNIPLSKTR